MPGARLITNIVLVLAAIASVAIVVLELAAQRRTHRKRNAPTESWVGGRASIRGPAGATRLNHNGASHAGQSLREVRHAR